MTQEPCKDEPEDGPSGRAIHLTQRIERRHYRQWEQNLRQKMRGHVNATRKLGARKSP
jgi:hypothetical protein